MWKEILLVVCAVSTGILGWVTYRRSSKADEVLDVAANVKTTFEAQTEIQEGLRADITRLRQSLAECEQSHINDRAAIEAAQDIVLEQARRISRLKATVDEHEETISRHELTINQLRAGTPADRRDT